MASEPQDERLLPEWRDDDEVDDATFAASIEAARRQQFAELADL